MRGRKASPETLSAVARVLKGEAVKDAAAAEGTKIWNVYAALKQRGEPVSLLKVRRRAQAAAMEAEARRRRDAARKVVIAAGLALQRSIVDRADELLTAGRPPAAAIEVLQREAAQRLITARRREATRGRGLPAIGRTFDDMQAEIEELRERLDHMSRTFLNRDYIAPREFKLSPSEQCLLGLLIIREQVTTRAQMLDALYGLLPDSDEPEIKIIDVFVCKLRRRLKPFGLSIETIWGVGYIMPPECRERLKAWPTFTQSEAA